MTILQGNEETYLLFTSRISSSSLYHLMVESLSTLKNWHQSFRCPEASGNGSPRILRITCGAGGAWKGGGGGGGQDKFT